MARSTRSADAGGTASSALLGGLAVVLLGLLAFASLAALAPPEPRPASGSEGRFSAERAFVDVRHIAGRPHPVGSEANAGVRRYVVRQLRQLGLDPDVRRATVRGSSESGAVVARVRNIHARIPGSASTGNVVLVAHYDSVAGGPGAADDASGVAAVLEIARALTQRQAPRNDVHIVLTDGEEQGLLGARAFVAADVLDPRRSVVLNLEARGSCGPSIMFETSVENAGVVPVVARGGDPFASSLTDAVYRLLPNDTDFTAFREAGYAGLNYAFIGCVANYHTPGDTPANLSRSSLQHQGASVLAAARHLGQADLPAVHGGGQLTYASVLGQLVRYPQELTLPLAITASVALALTLLYARRHGARLRRVGVAAASLPAPLLVTAAVGLGVTGMLDALRPGYGFLAVAYHGSWYSAGMVACAAATTAGWGLLLRRVGSTATESALGVWVWLAVGALACAVLLPGGAHLFTWPLLAGSLALAATLRLRAGPPWRAFACCAAAAPAVVVILPVSRLLRQTFPVASYPAVLVAVVLASAVPLLHLLAPRRSWYLPVVAAVAGLGLLTGMGFVGPDERHPRHVSLMYALDADRGRARWLSADREPAPWIEKLVLARRGEIDAWLPPTAGQRFRTGRARPVELEPADITVLASRRDGGTRVLRLRVTGGGAARVAVYADTADHRVVAASVAGVGIGDTGTRSSSGTPWGWGVSYHGPPSYRSTPSKGVELVLRVRGDGPLRLRTVTDRHGLPHAGNLSLPLPESLSWAGHAANRTVVSKTLTV